MFVSSAGRTELTARSTATTEGGIVVVEIANGVKHQIHRALLVRHSEYFKTALKGPWKEAKEGMVRLEDVESGPCRHPIRLLAMEAALLTCAVDVFVVWLYTQKIAVPSKSGKVDEDISDMTEIHAIVLGDRLLAPAFTKAMQRHFVERYATHIRAPAFTVVTCAYSNLPEDSPILEMLADMHTLFYIERPAPKHAANSASEAIDSRHIEHDLPRSFLIRIMHRYAQRLTLPNPTHVLACDYIEHNDALEKAACKCSKSSTEPTPSLSYENHIDHDAWEFDALR